MNKTRMAPVVPVCAVVFLLGIIASTLAVDVPLDCQSGWTNISAHCYRLFEDVLPWESADRVCQSYGSRLARVKDYYQNEDIGMFAQKHSTMEYWIGASRGTSRTGTQVNDERALKWSDGTDTTVAVGHWQNAQPESDSGQCVLVKVSGGRALWSLMPCEKKSAYVCQRPAAPRGSFHCHNGHFVRMGLKCDGEDDCGDGSDELDCDNRCSYHINDRQSGNIQSGNYPNMYPNQQTCTWLIEVPLGYNVRLQFLEFNTEAQTDEVMVLAGGLTLPTSYMVARLSGNMSDALPTYTSRNNFMMVIFSTDDTMSDRGFRAQFTSVKEEMFPTRKTLTATDTPKELRSPKYPGYLSSQDYTWIITASEKVKLVTLEIVEVDLKGADSILIRDGDMVFHKLLANLTAESEAMPSYILSTGRDLYITMQTRSKETGRGFVFRYWQGCQVTLNSTSGHIHSPGFSAVGGQYGSFQTCTYDVIIPGGATVTVKFDRMKLHETDEVMVYEGNNLLYNVTEEMAPPPFMINSGSFRVVFDSDAILTDEGFSLTYSVGCSNPNFNTQTILTPAVTEFPFGTKVKVSCQTGYAFAAVEFQDLNVADNFEPLKEITLECLAGGMWNVRTKPICEPRYCGKAPAVTNAYVRESTGVTYLNTVTYECYPGFAMTGSSTINCTEDGGWTNTATCQTSACSSLANTIQNGFQRLLSGDGTSFSSIVEYVCEPGYQIIGSPILFCGSDGLWSDTTPRCEILKCYVPSIPNGMLERSGQFIDVGERVVASCNDDYVSSIPGGGTNTVTCSSSRTLIGLDGFTCSYQNKCTAEPSYCAQICKDSEFMNRTCSCKQGYTLAQDMRTCDDIDECSNNNGDCDQLCSNVAGSYRCGCLPGFVLFSSEGIGGYQLARNENGMRNGDIRRLNHSCLPVKCPDPPAVPNGNLMVNLNSYHFGDYVEYFCNLGYELSGFSLLTCNESGQWDRSPPDCNPAVCLPDSIPASVRNPAMVNPSGPVGFGETVTLTCNVPGKQVFTKTRECIYHQGTYQLVGADYECGLIDCGQPAIVSGSQYLGLNHSNTTYGTSFQFNCQNLYNVQGASEAGDNTVRCLQDGRWDFGSLRCEGLKCTDPGRPPDGQQVNSTSYDQGDLVYFACDKVGFTLDNPYPLLCQLNTLGNGLEWNSTVPECIDTQLPVINGCPDAPIPVKLYTRANNLTIPTARDNVYVSKYRITDPVGDDTWPSQEYILSKMTTFNVTAYDHRGNGAHCVAVVTIIDDIPPTIQCPNIEREFSTENEALTIDFNTVNPVTVSDNKEAKNPTYSPSVIRFTADASMLNSTFPPFRSYEVMASVQDGSGNMASCSFELMFRAASCSPFSMRTPLHGSKRCTETTPSYRCELSCDPGYVFYEDPSTPTLVRTCNKGGQWDMRGSQACVRADDPSNQARFRQTFRFTYTKTEAGSCTNFETYRTLLTDALETSEVQIPTLCNFQDGQLQGDLTISDIAEEGQNVFVNVTFTHGRRDVKDYESCKVLVTTNFEQDNFEITAPLRTTFNPIGCPGIQTSSGGTPVLTEYFCESGKQIKYQPSGFDSPIDVCVSCPEGSRTVGSTCELCPVGSYTDNPGRSSCVDCPTGQSTFRLAAVSRDECTAMCKPGTFSETGLPPCNKCPKNTYSTNNSTFCTPCTPGDVTRTAGSTQPAQCLPPCPKGTYNPIDGHGDPNIGCTPCPQHFYANRTGMTACTECSGNDMTDQGMSASAEDCIAHPGCNASNNPCQNGGQCNIVNHAVTCTCPDGYNGQYCGQEVTPCSSNPCYFGAVCTSTGDSFTCTCPTGTGGPRCENLAASCTADTCLNGGACRNDLNKFTCLCRLGFSGNRCEQTQPICSPNPCQNGATCRSLDNIRYRCECPTGYDGVNCENNINDCASNPCLHGGNCTDRLNNFECSCPTGFSGSRCEVRQVMCSANTCNTGACVEDHQASTYRCVCPEGHYYGNVCQYEAYFGLEANGSVAWVYEESGVSIQHCMAKCEEVDCKELVYDNNSAICRVADPRQRISVRQGASVYYYRVCRNVEETYWTPWYDSYIPNPAIISGDDELLVSLNQWGLNICGGTDPIEAQCQQVQTKAPPNQVLAVNCEATRGLLCLDTDQPNNASCNNHEIRFKCLSSRVLSRSPCQDINYCDNSSVCQNGGACRDAAVTEPVCDCVTGYSGSRCQHDEDNCATNPCQNDGTCVDLFDNYRCDCVSGYSGTNCEQDFNDCASNPCDLTGTMMCKDHLNRYECVCNPGFTGERCESDINECESQPCMHQGQCMNGANSFTCTCLPGWTGKMCETKQKLCNTSTCSNGAPCSNLFNDFYCSCLPNTYGKTCSNAPSICLNANPCLHGSTCSESQGIASCQCPREYVSAVPNGGCDLKKDVCSTTSPVCMNGASCTSSIDEYSCHCPEGYTGKYCEQNIDDCLGNKCPATSTCIDMVAKHYCRCPVRKAGENCEKDVNREFDLLFSKPQKNNMAALGYPLHLTGDGFTITMWVQYYRKGETGTFFTLYQVRDPNSLAEKKELIRMDETGVMLSLDGLPMMLNTTVDYNVDGEWHYIVLSWNKITGLFSFFVDTVRIPLPNYNTGQPLDLHVWMVLGCRYDTKTDMCHEGQGFNGLISQVTLYNRELIFRDELTIVGNNNPFVVFPGDVMSWGEFLLYPGVSRVYPSMADKSCPRGFSQSSCNEPVPGKTMVTIENDSCPKDIIIHSTKRVTQVSWDDIAFGGQANSVKPSMQSGVPLLWGKYPVIVEGSNLDGNKALCTFDIYVQYDQCKTPETPANADQVFCANFTDEKDRGYRQCSVTCKSQNRVVVPSPKIHTCGPVGSFDPPNRYLPYTLPPCGPTSTPKRRLIVVIVYHVPSIECPTVTQDLREQIELRLQEQNTRAGGSLCQSADCSDIKLSFNCVVSGSALTGRRKRQAVNYRDVTATITADDVPATLTNLDRSPEDLFQQLVLSDTVFDFSNRIAEATPDPNGLDVQIQLQCFAPMALIGDMCVECAPGSYYNNSTETCELCAIGSYQPAGGTTECIQCSPGTVTETKGSVDSNQCKESCKPGSFYSNADGGCVDCPQGFYQNISGLFFCMPCPVDKTTRMPGAASESVCYNDCLPGQELSENGTCTPCPIGSFKPSDITLCTACPPSLVTNETGADSMDDCNVADSQPGYYRTRPDETKSEPCPIGTYQPLKWQYNCISCGGDRYRTDQMGSRSKDQCKFFCPAGQEKVENLDQCRPCAIGYYRTGDDYYSECQLCPNNTRTINTGSTSVNDCTLYKCTAGYRPTAQDTCEECPRGTYQPDPDQTDCLRCLGNMMDTRTTASTSLTQCEKYCESGYEKLDNGTCVICPIGFFKDNTIDNFHQCTRCTDTRYVTPTDGATSQNNCTVLDCAAGTRINGNVCEDCPQGTYQDKPYQSNCIDCPSLQSTRGNASTSLSDCETYCEPGAEKKGDRCMGCERGFYKNNLKNVFMDCTLCPLEFVTPRLNSTTQSECTVRNCTAGQYITGNNCTLCGFGFYQPDNWQTSCLKCGTDRTTTRLGAESEDECILSCPPGKENLPSTDVCTDCPQGSYKDKEEASRCDPCRDGYVTRINGSTDAADCELRACEPGSYASADSCIKCAFSQYQPMKWQEQCIPCDDGFTTVVRGADSKDQCIRDCPSGQQYNNQSKACEPCPIGFYNDDLNPSIFTCIMCPIDFITPNTGATAVSQCNIRNCTVPGQYRDTQDNACRDCPRGQWQNQKWMTSCELCSPGLTTESTGTASPDDCLTDCPSGQELDMVTKSCVDCAKGTYRNKADRWSCEPCAPGLTTPGTRAASRDECTISTCPKGQFFDRSPQEQKCTLCSSNTYQDEEGQFTCKPCPDRTTTNQAGATMASMCIDNCLSTSTTCDENASCASTTTGVTCACKNGFIGDGKTCTHICDVVGYCQNGATCERTTNRCLCKENYDGDQCQLRTDPQKAGLTEKDTIIVAVVATLAFLLFLILLIVCCCVNARKRQRNKVPFAETSDERVSIATRMSTRGYDDFGTGYSTKPPSFNQGPRMMLPAQAQQMYENPTYTVNDGDPAVYKV